jgi:uncharacterized repeat protein (TIGR03803 family)
MALRGDQDMRENTSVPEAGGMAANSGKTRQMRKQNFFSAAIFLLALAVTIPSARAQTFRVLHEFNGQSDGALPQGALVRDAAGNLFGTTFTGGGGQGTVFTIDSRGRESIVLTFNAFVSGASPASALIRDQAGNLYGTADGGPGGAGVVFKLTPQGEQTLLHAFQGGLGRTARVPSGGPFMDKSGNIFGTTLFGGSGSCQFGCGSIYRLSPAGKLNVLYKFTGGADGIQPFGPLVQDAAGNLYGVARSGGDLTCAEFPGAGCGTVFKLSKARVLTVLHTFHGGMDGASPQPGLLLDAAGNLLGAAGAGGNSGNGLIFKITSSGQYTVLHRFTANEGKTPNGSLVADPAGNLYGTAQTGGVEGQGTVFRLTPAGQLKVLHAFTGDLDGAFPLAGLIRDAAGHLYGTAVKNFLINQFNGNVFEITP